MKILKAGTLPENKIRRFKCAYCECIFECSKREFKCGQQYNEIYYTADCPECGKSANEYTGYVSMEVKNDNT